MSRGAPERSGAFSGIYEKTCFLLLFRFWGPWACFGGPGGSPRGPVHHRFSSTPPCYNANFGLLDTLWNHRGSKTNKKQ